MKNTARALTLCALYFCVAPAYAQADLKAKDAVDFYLSYCVKTVGSKTTAVTVLGEGNALSKKLSEETVEKMQRMKGGVAWLVISPRCASMILDYHPSGICGVRVKAADQASIQKYFEAAVKDASANMKFEPKKNQIKQSSRAALQEFFSNTA